MTAAASPTCLSELHRQLETHFAAIRSQRDQEVGPGFPVFALEHGLAEAELSLLTSAVRGALQCGTLPRTAWLPFVVYATETGYE
jgi:hypothetical protein